MRTIQEYRRKHLIDWLTSRREEMQARIDGRLGVTLVIDGNHVVDTLCTFLDWSALNLEHPVIWTNWYKKRTAPRVVYHSVLLGSSVDLVATRMAWNIK